MAKNALVTQEEASSLSWVDTVSPVTKLEQGLVYVRTPVEEDAKVVVKAAAQSRIVRFINEEVRS